MSIKKFTQIDSKPGLLDERRGTIKYQIIDNLSAYEASLRGHEISMFINKMSMVKYINKLTGLHLKVSERVKYRMDCPLEPSIVINISWILDKHFLLGGNWISYLTSWCCPKSTFGILQVQIHCHLYISMAHC